jgi:hypothetical protein
MAVEGENEIKNKFRNQKMNLREVDMKHGCLVVFIRQYSAEIWGFSVDLDLASVL